MEKIEIQVINCLENGIKPSILIAGIDTITILKNYCNYNLKSDFILKSIVILNYKLNIISVDQSDICEVYGNEREF